MCFKSRVAEIYVVADAEKRRLYIRFGEIPKDENSKDHARDKKLKGVSVYWAHKKGDLWYVDGDTIHPTYSYLTDDFVNGDRNAYLVSGIEVGFGPDREPLIKDVKIEKKLGPLELTDFEGKISRAYYWTTKNKIDEEPDPKARKAMHAYFIQNAKEYDVTLEWLKKKELRDLKLLKKAAMKWYYEDVS